MSNFRDAEFPPRVGDEIIELNEMASDLVVDLMFYIIDHATHTAEFPERHMTVWRLPLDMLPNVADTMKFISKQYYITDAILSLLLIDGMVYLVRQFTTSME